MNGSQESCLILGFYRSGYRGLATAALNSDLRSGTWIKMLVLLSERWIYCLRCALKALYSLFYWFLYSWPGLQWMQRVSWYRWRRGRNSSRIVHDMASCAHTLIPRSYLEQPVNTHAGFLRRRGGNRELKKGDPCDTREAPHRLQPELRINPPELLRPLHNCAGLYTNSLTGFFSTSATTYPSILYIYAVTNQCTLHKSLKKLLSLYVTWCLLN